MASERTTATAGKATGGRSSTPTGGLSSSTVVLIVVLLLVAVLRPVLGESLIGDEISAWATIFTAMFVQAAPFLVLGVAISAAVAAFVPESFFEKALPKRPGTAIPIAGAAGIVLPGCECGSVPIAKGLFNKGVPLSAALAFMLSAPAINPVVLIATAVAFPGTPEMVLGRFAASLLLAVVMGYLWAWFGRSEWVRPRELATHARETKWATFVGTATHDFLHTGGYLVIGAGAAATLQVIVPPSIMNDVATEPGAAAGRYMDSPPGAHRRLQAVCEGLVRSVAGCRRRSAGDHRRGGPGDDTARQVGRSRRPLAEYRYR